MTFKPRAKAKDNGPVLKRDQHNKLDMDAAAQVQRQLTEKLLTEERAHKKDITFNAKGNKRDFIVMVTVLQRNSIDGHLVFGEDETKGFEVYDPRDPFKYRVYDYVEAPILCRDIPMSKNTCAKQMAGIFNVLITYLARLSVVNSV